MTDTTTDDQAPRWTDDELADLHRGRCPYSGLELERIGVEPPTLECGVCDCFGFAPSEVGVQPDAS